MKPGRGRPCFELGPDQHRHHHHGDYDDDHHGYYDDDHHDHDYLTIEDQGNNVNYQSLQG